MFDLRPDMDLKELKFDVYQFLDRYGFGDGDRILEEEESIAETLANRLANVIGIVEGEWEPYVINSGHNPYYIRFRNLSTGEDAYYFEMCGVDKRKIERGKNGAKMVSQKWHKNGVTHKNGAQKCKNGVRS